MGAIEQQHVLPFATADGSNFGAVENLPVLPRSEFAVVPKVLFLDMNAFYASVEQQDNPMYRGCPLAVVPVLAERTSVIAASYEAKRFGVHTGTKVAEARQRCPELIVVEARRERYIEVHAAILECVGRHFSSFRPLSVDEVACRLDESLQTIDAARDRALRIKADLLERLGPCLLCSIGIGPNNFLAKIAADIQKPNGLTIFTADYPQVLSELSLQDLPGIGPKTELKLMAHGIHSVAALLSASPELLVQACRGPSGLAWYHRLRGSLEHDYSPYSAARKQSAGRSRVLAPEFRTPDDAQRILRQLGYGLLRSLRDAGAKASRVDVAVAYWHGIDGRYRNREDHEVRVTASNTDLEWGTQMGMLIDRVVAPVRRPFWIHIGFSQMQPGAVSTPGLFDSTREQQARHVAEVVDRINDRFRSAHGGEGVIQPASTLGKSQAERVIPFGPPDVRGLSHGPENTGK